MCSPDADVWPFCLVTIGWGELKLREKMAADLNRDLQLQIGHVLFMDIVGYSKLLVDEQFRSAEAVGKLVRLPTGDGMALAFFTSPDAPVRCA